MEQVCNVDLIDSSFTGQMANRHEPRVYRTRIEGKEDGEEDGEEEEEEEEGVSIIEGELEA